MTPLLAGISTGIGAAKLAMGVVVGLIVLKVVVSVISRSISISAQAADSFLDIFSIAITFVALRMSVAPADEEHPFGHGKVEGLAAMVQAVLVVGAGAFIAYSAVQRIIHSRAIEPDEGMAVMVISIIASLLLSRHLRHVAKASGSMAIEALARNISADVYSAAGVLLGLLAVRTTGFVILDPIIALVMSGFVLKAGYEVSRRAVQELLDRALPGEEREVLHTLLRLHNTQLVDYHALRSRSSGIQRFIDLHVVIPRDISIEQAHSMCDHLEKDIRERLKNANVIIHAEPCSYGDCGQCSIRGCSLRGVADLPGTPRSL